MFKPLTATAIAFVLLLGAAAGTASANPYGHDFGSSITSGPFSAVNGR